MKVLGTFTIISIAVGAAVDRTPTALELRARRLALKTGQDIPNPDQIDYIINAYNVGVAKNTLNSVTDPMTTMFIVLCEIASGKSVSSDPCREYIEGDKVETAKEELKKLLVLASKIRLAVAEEPKVVPLAGGDARTGGSTEAAVVGGAVTPSSVHGGSRPILPARTPRADGEGESEAGSGDDTSPASTHETAGGALVEGDALLPGGDRFAQGESDSDFGGLGTEKNDPPGPAAAFRAGGFKRQNAVIEDEDSAGSSENSGSSTRAVDGSIRASATVAAGAVGRRSLLATLPNWGIDTSAKPPVHERDRLKAEGEVPAPGKVGSTKVPAGSSGTVQSGFFFDNGVAGYRFQSGNAIGLQVFDRFGMDHATADRVADELGGEGGDE